MAVWEGDMRYPRRTVLGLLATLCVCAGSLSAFAQGYPARPIRVIAPWPPGSSVDLSVRTVALKLNDILKTNLIIENRGGADGSIGTELAARAAPDGYTLVWGNAATHGANKVVYPNLSYDPVKDFTPISLVHKNVLSVAVNPSLPVNTFAEFLAFAKAHPGKLSYGTPGVGSPHHLTGILLNRRAQIEIVHVPYKGGGPAVTDVIGGHIQFTVASLAAVIPFHRSGKLKILAVTDSTRYEQLPDIPAIAETFPGFEILGWSAVFGPANMPADITARLNAAVGEALQAPEVKATLNKAGLVPVWSSPGDLAKRVNAEIGYWREAAASGMKFR
jgi:tripartite-type tricarboxylate transporter receptor subunit TctC